MSPRAAVGAPWPAWKHGVVAGVGVAVLGAALAALPWFWPLQESFDLWVLFKLRGPQAPPDDIVLVTIDQQSSERIALPSAPEARERCLDLRVGETPASHERLPPPHLVMRWPRCLHGLAVRALAAAGARVIALDISFRPLSSLGLDNSSRSEDEQDRVLANAIESAGNVLLAQWLDPIEVSRQRATANSLQRPARISPLIASAALGAAPLRLAWGLSGRVNSFAAFSEEEVPISSLPALVFHLSAAEVHSDFVRLLAKVSPDNAELLPRTAQQLVELKPLQATSLAIRYLVRADPKVPASLRESLEGRQSAVAPARHRPALRALVDLYAGDAVRYLNFYGYPGTFPSVSYADVLTAATSGGGHALQELRGKTVVVGYADFTPAQRDDHYPTVYTTSDGVKLSGGEILATAVANLATRTSLVAPPPALRAALTAGFGMVLGVLLLVPSALRGLAAACALSVAYLALTLLLFRFEAIWLPVLVPLVVQAPAGILYALTHHYRDIGRKRDELRALFGKFVPGRVIESLLENREKLDTVTEPVYSVCLATDADRFSTLAESMHPAQLARFLNQYFQVVFAPITEEGGDIVDVVGDAVLAVWTGPESDRALHVKATGAALELMAAVNQFNAASPSARLPTRIGISAGSVSTTAMGAVNHYEFRPVGDTVVTSTRLQG
jgi:adenylate cyclase